MTEFPSRALISKSAFVNNLDRIRDATSAEIMAIVKGNAYGHGLERIARWAHEAGVRWFGVAQLAEALELRSYIPQARILTWIYTPGTDLTEALGAELDLSVGSVWALEEVGKAAKATGRTARVHIKVDTAMARGGLSPRELDEQRWHIAALEEEDLIDVVGLWSHLARADEPDHPETARQVERFEQAGALLAEAGVVPKIRHLAASAGTLWHPATHYDMVRPGVALYGLSPDASVQTASDLGLRAVMRLEADVMTTRDVPAGTGISYNHTYVTPGEAHLGVVPLGYADGIGRMASNSASVTINGKTCPIRGKVCMDQFIVEGEGIEPGHVAVLFGDAREGLATADDWGAKTQTIGYEVVTRIGSHVPRVDAP
ncbi:alanine racemase [Trueperella pecoris]|uniref:alanine racemase n=1 Tax=Trueperella pecoris TaxID=2733571 RepID=UPI00186B6672|nr:alanine racemase [Trueperella pecoris]QOQ38411.1 alanine racemase [Trueperella pecoris]QTG75007.1 alanine racemase [Trueperella pecoris]